MPILPHDNGQRWLNLGQVLTFFFFRAGKMIVSRRAWQRPGVERYRNG